MKVLVASLLTIVCAGSVAMAKGSDSKKAKTAACSPAEKKQGKCGATTAKAGASSTTAAAASVRAGSMENPSSRAPASVDANNTH